MPIPPCHPAFGHFIIGHILMFIGVIAVLFGILPAILQWLWNSTIPEIFKLPIITFWQSLRLFLISIILFGGLFHCQKNNPPPPPPLPMGEQSCPALH